MEGEKGDGVCVCALFLGVLKGCLLFIFIFFKICFLFLEEWGMG